MPPRLTAAYTWGANGLISERLIQPSVSLWYAYGPQGETRQLTNSSAQVVDSYSYSGYGAAVSAAGSDPNPFRYGGQFGYYTDVNGTGVILCGARWYAPVIGRWLTRDPISYDGGENLYAYCRDNPVGMFDPSGLDGSIWKSILDHLKAGCSSLKASAAHVWKSLDEADYLGGFILGLGPDYTAYSPGDPHSQQLKSSKDGLMIQNELAQLGYPAFAKGGIHTRTAAKNSFTEWNGTRFEVGAFSWDAAREGNMMLIHAHNVSSFNSLVYHIPSFFFGDGAGQWNRNTFPYFGNVTQDFYWWIPVPSHKSKCR